MAGGFLCKKCGWQETEHGYKGELTQEEIDNPRNGYDLSLAKCLGYIPEQEDLAAERIEAILAAEEENKRQRTREEQSYFD